MISMANESGETETVYANVFEATLGAYDMVLDFGYRSPEQGRETTGNWTRKVRVSMSLGHAKSMLPILAKLISTYEQEFGEIPAPGFEDRSRE